MAVNKVVYGDKVLIDISDSTVTPETLAEGVVAYNAKGERIVGTHKCSGGGTSHYTDAVLGSAKLGSAVLWSNTRLGAVELGSTILHERNN